MRKFFCTGRHSDGSEVVALITHLDTFIKASPDEFVTVECDDVYHQVKKGDVEWQGIQEVNVLT